MAGPVRANRRIAAQFVRNDRLEALVAFRDAAPDDWERLPGDLRQRVGAYTYVRDVFLATTGGPIDTAPSSGGALLNAALRAATGRPAGAKRQDEERSD